jgi:hypothetical protein
MRWHRLSIEDHHVLGGKPQATRKRTVIRNNGYIDSERPQPRDRIRESAVSQRHDDSREPILNVFVCDDIEERVIGSVLARPKQEPRSSPAEADGQDCPMVAGDDDQIVRPNSGGLVVVLATPRGFDEGRTRAPDEVLDVHEVEAPGWVGFALHVCKSTPQIL